MKPTVSTEAFSGQLFEEILPLAQKCWEESTRLKGEACAFYGERDFAIEPNVDEYRKLAAIGSLVIVTLRDGAGLQGFVDGFTYRSLHHQRIIGAIGDTIYVEPERRSYAGVLIDQFLNEMTARRAAIIGWPVTSGGYVHELLLARGFVGDDVVMEKRLCA